MWFNEAFIYMMRSKIIVWCIHHSALTGTVRKPSANIARYCPKWEESVPLTSN